MQEINEVIKNRLDRSFPGQGWGNGYKNDSFGMHKVYKTGYLQPLQNVIEDQGFPQDLANRVKNNFNQFCMSFESAIEGILQKNFPKPESLCVEQVMDIIRLIVFGYQIMHVNYLSSEKYAADLEESKKPFEKERTALSEWLPLRIPNFLLQKSNMYILFRNFLWHKSLVNDPLDNLDKWRDDVLAKLEADKP